MTDEYKRPYLILFNFITDALAEIEQNNFGKAHDILVAAQCTAEEAFLSAGGSKEEVERVREEGQE